MAKEMVKCWVGNLDGTREGLVIASSKAKATKVIGTSMNDFNSYWHQATRWPSQSGLEPYVLYARPFGSRDEWKPRWDKEQS